MGDKRQIASETIYIQPSFDPSQPDGGERIRKTSTEYDEQGRQVRESTWDINGNYEQIIETDYDGEGRVQAQRIFLDEKHLSETRSFHYDEQGRLKEQTTVYAEGGEERMLCFYDEQGRLLRREYLSEDGEQEALESNEYGHDGPIRVSREEYGELVYEKEMTYEDGRLLSERNVEDLVENLLSIEYDGDGRIATETESVNGKVSRIRTFSYDDDGRLLTEEENKEGDRYHTRYEYDGNGNEAFREVTRPDGTLVLRVRRSFAGDGLQEVTEVEADSQGIGVDRHYRYLFEYTFHGEG